MTDDVAVSVAILALQRSGKVSASVARETLLRLRGSHQTNWKTDQVLDFAGVDRPSINASVGEADRDIEKGLAMQISPIPISSNRYPAALRGIDDAPAIIFVRGNVDVLTKLPGVAVVGTRKASPHGLLIARRIAEFISESGWCVVSGLALGIDASAHEGAIAGKTPTIAVLAHGLEKAQPTANRPLAQRILEAGGLWVSEHVTGTGAKPANFVLRNRIQVGLSCASIIVEGEEQSGSKTQAEFCLRNRRTLFGVLPEPGSKVSTVSALPRMLVSVRNAIPIYSKEDYPSMMTAITRSAQFLEARPGDANS